MAAATIHRPFFSRTLPAILFILISRAVYSQDKNSKDSLYSILVLGITTRKIQIESEVGKQFGFRYKVAPWRKINGMEISPNTDSMERENRRIYKLIARKYGTNWASKFHQESNRVYSNWNSLYNYFDKDSTFIDLRDSLTKDLDLDNRYDFEIQKELQRNKSFQVVYYFYTKVNNKLILNRKKLLAVDLSRHAIKILD